MDETATATTLLSTYTFGEEALGPVKRLVHRLLTRCDRDGAAELWAEFIPIADPPGARRYRLVLVATSMPRIGGFELVGKVEHRSPGTNVVHDFVGAGLVDRFAQAPASCAHCGRARRRVETFLLREADGEVRQVGRNCLRAYALTSNGAVEAALGVADLIAELSAALREWGEDPTSVPMSLRTYLEFVAEALMRGGWVSAGKSRKTGDPSTAEQALRLFAGRGPTVPRPAARGLAEQALGWVRSLPTQNHEYLESLRRVCAADVIKRRDAGLAASVLWAYRSRHHLKVVPPVDVEPPRPITSWDVDEYQRLVLTLEPPMDDDDHLMSCQDNTMAFQVSAEDMAEMVLDAEGQPDAKSREAEVQTAGDIIAYLAHYLSARGIALSEVLEKGLARIARRNEEIEMAVASLRAKSG